ncbi:hypothetical protein GCM10011414_23750 [Croceivirga lutea]|uniref:sensor histidine kinase n=1 Tax=Croceivirga lutea TaxID=1775167 RepID=UPI001639E364|nr:GAF domain-containing sensor histidine kinase [Croceivirga lutea]GGG53315.1 hypothetical protein GCM10011414_23750 [Croceivirga lutea]
MVKPEIPVNEIERLNELDSYNILDTLSEKEYDSITKLASIICNTPISLISLIDEKRQWFKSKVGIDATETPRELAFCAHAINEPNQLLEVSDARSDFRFKDNPLTVEDPHVIFYAGMPLVTTSGNPMGTLCVIDHKPRKLNQTQIEALQALSVQVVQLLENRRLIVQLDTKNNKIEKLVNQLNDYSHSFAHELRTPIRGNHSILQWFKEDYGEKFDEHGKSLIDYMQDNFSYMDALTRGMQEYHEVSMSNFILEHFNLEKQFVQFLDTNQEKIEGLELETVNLNHDIYHYKKGLELTLKHLLTNTRLHAGANSKIRVEYSTNEEKHHLIYEDDGPGIEPKYHNKVFELFTSLEKIGKHNCGMGLAIIKNLITQFEGTIRLTKSDYLGGLKVTITVPIEKPTTF